FLESCPNTPLSPARRTAGTRTNRKPVLYFMYPSLTNVEKCPLATQPPRAPALSEAGREMVPGALHSRSRQGAGAVRVAKPFLHVAHLMTQVIDHVARARRGLGGKPGELRELPLRRGIRSRRLGHAVPRPHGIVREMTDANHPHSRESPPRLVSARGGA